MYLFFKKGEKKQFVSFDSTLMARQVASSLFKPSLSSNTITLI